MKYTKQDIRDKLFDEHIDLEEFMTMVKEAWDKDVPTFSTKTEAMDWFYEFYTTEEEKDRKKRASQTIRKGLSHG